MICNELILLVVSNQLMIP